MHVYWGTERKTEEKSTITAVIMGASQGSSPELCAVDIDGSSEQQAMLTCAWRALIAASSCGKGPP